MGILVIILLILSVPFFAGMVIGYAIGRHSKGKGVQSSALSPRIDHPLALRPHREDRQPGQEPAAGADALREPGAPRPAQWTAPSRPPASAQSQQVQSTNAQLPTILREKPTGPPPKKPRRARTPADEHRSINISLYVGGLVLTAAALAFVAASQTPVFTAVSLILAYLVFAVTGLLLSSRVTILKPAGYAIFGTSLALLAVAAVPVNEAFIQNGRITWMAVSVVGLVVYGYASMHLDSRVLGYLVIPFLYSSIFGSTSVLQTPLVWTLVAIMVISAAVQLGVLVLGERFPAVLRRPFNQLHWIVVPGVLIAAALLAGEIGSRDYALLFTATAGYYAVNAVRPVAAEYRPVLALASRVAATAALLSLLLHYRVEAAGALAVLSLWCAVVFLLVAVTPLLSGLPRGQRMLVQGITRRRMRRWDLGGSLAAAVLPALAAQAVLVLPGSALTAVDYGWLALASGALVVAGGYALLVLAKRGRPPEQRALGLGLRCTLGVAGAMALPHHPWFTVMWLAVWAAAEFKMATPAVRGLIHRAQAVTGLAVVGWSLGRLTDDAVLGGRLVLLGLALGAAVVVLLLAVRGLQWQAPPVESVIYWVLSAAGLAAGAGAFGLSGVLQPVYAVAAMAVVYGTAVLMLVRTPDAMTMTTEQQYSWVRSLSFAAGAIIAVLSIDWVSAWVMSGQPSHPAAGYALITLIAFGAAEALTAGALTPARWGRTLRPGHAPGLWAPELWPGTHLAMHGIWAGLINLAVLYGDSVLPGTAGHLWWLTVPAWAIACWAGLHALRRRDRETVSTTARLIPSRLYGALVLAGAVVVVFTGTGAWWADAAVAAAAALVALLAFRSASRLPESPVAAPAAAAAAVYLLGRAVTELLPGADHRYPLDLLLVAGLAVAASTVAALVLMGTGATSSEVPDAASRNLNRRHRVLAASGTAAVVAFLLSAWHLLGLSSLRAAPAEAALQVLLGGAAIICLHLLVHRAAQHPAGVFSASGRASAAQGTLPDGSTAPGSAIRLSLTGVRLTVFAAALVLSALALNWPAAVHVGRPAPLDAVHLVSAAGALALAGLVFAGELAGTARLSRGPAHRWVPTHLAANVLWLAVVNMVMLLLGLAGDLWWFTAVPWAVASVIFARGAVRAAGSEDPLPVRDLFAARAYACAVLLIMLGVLVIGGAWWVQAVVAAAVAMVGAGALIWGARLPEAPFAAPGYLAAGSAALTAVITAELLRGVQLFGAPGNHASVLGYLSGTGVFIVLVVSVLVARRRWPRGSSRRQLMTVTGAGAALASLAPLVSAEQHVAAPLAWTVPAMHVAMTAAALRLRRLRHPAALLGPIVLPFSVLFAYGTATDPGAVAVAVTLLVVLTMVLAAELWLYPRSDRDRLSGWQLAHWLTGGIAVLLLSAVALLADAAAVQFTALGGAALLLVAGLLRGVRLGVYWGAVVIILSILWALREIMFLFLIAVGALIIGAAIWRLIAVQKKQQDNDAAPAPDTKTRQNT
ncbi:hypothetical protein [Nesterenkonia muleiensis]|uniref:hypothetical protein n=1 Tax=Nesterenkonia muleiensis TaxID=2282648 RepID=UPI00130031B8|nr:hypothetical protein [Nesterenkonia muleiensis]